jgi:hypothetical protein
LAPGAGEWAGARWLPTRPVGPWRSGGGCGNAPARGRAALLPSGGWGAGGEGLRGCGCPSVACRLGGSPVASRRAGGRNVPVGARGVSPRLGQRNDLRSACRCPKRGPTGSARCRIVSAGAGRLPRIRHIGQFLLCLRRAGCGAIDGPPPIGGPRVASGVNLSAVSEVPEVGNSGNSFHFQH